MDVDITIGVLKIATALIGGALGIAGLLANYRDANGKLTRAGVAVFSGIALSAVVGVITSGIEATRDRASSREQAARTEALLHELSRSIQPIRELSVVYWMEIPQGNKIVDAYVSRLKSGIENRLQFLSRLSPRVEATKGLEAWAADSYGQPLDVKITSESDLWPQGEEADIARLLAFSSLNVDIFKKPIIPENYEPIVGVSDFGASAGIFPKRAELSWDLKKKRLNAVIQMQFDKSLWKTNGAVTSVVDLYGAQILLIPSFSSNMEIYNGKLVTVLESPQKELARSTKLQTIMLDFGEGRSFWINGDKFRKTAYKTGYPIYSVSLPKSQTELMEFTKPKDPN